MMQAVEALGSRGGRAGVGAEQRSACFNRPAGAGVGNSLKMPKKSQKSKSKRVTLKQKYKVIKKVGPRTTQTARHGTFADSDDAETSWRTWEFAQCALDSPQLATRLPPLHDATSQDVLL